MESKKISQITKGVEKEQELSLQAALKAKKILVADDNPHILSIVKEMLEDEGFQVVTLVSLEDVFFFVRNIQADLLILDIVMPHKEGLDGFDICRKIKEDPQLKDLPVILFSSIADGTSTTPSEMCKSIGADGYIAKPFKRSTLIGKIKELLLYSAK